MIMARFAVGGRELEALAREPDDFGRPAGGCSLNVRGFRRQRTGYGGRHPQPEHRTPGALSLLGAWFYTGGKRPYGYRALGEVSVFVFFGLVAVLGTTYVQAETLSWTAVAGAVSVGSIACALLVANNLRDIPTDTVTGKRTLAVVLGAPNSRRLYAALIAIAFILAAVSVLATPWTLLAFIALPLAIKAIRVVLSDAVGPALIPVLKNTGLTELLYAIGLAIGLALGS